MTQQRPAGPRARATGPIRVAAAVAASVSLGLLAGCSSSPPPRADVADRGSTSSPSPSPSSPASAPASTPTTASTGGRYVALGDSYSAAPGVGTATGPAGCYRTDANYPHLLAAARGLDLVDVTCSSARSADLRTPQGADIPAQFDALTRDTVLVTLGIGGNDQGLFSALVTRCGSFGGAPSTPCAQNPRFAEPALTTELRALADSIADDVAAIRERAPRAEVVVVGYPQVVPERGPCTRLPIAAADLPFAHELNRRLDGAVRRGAREAGALFADVWAASRGHDACAADPWIAGIRPEGPAIPLHPYRAYEQATADVIADLID